MQRDSLPLSLDLLIERVATRYGFNIKLKRKRIWEVWERVVGPSVALNAWPCSFWQGDVLLVLVTNSVWMQQLSLQKPEILTRLNALLPKRAILKDIRFMLGDVGAARLKGPLKPQAKDTVTKTAVLEYDGEELRQAEEMTRSVTDPGLKNALKSLILKSQACKRTQT